jgi:hypothetical protein
MLSGSHQNEMVNIPDLKFCLRSEWFVKSYMLNWTSALLSKMKRKNLDHLKAKGNSTII